MRRTFSSLISLFLLVSICVVGVAHADDPTKAELEARIKAKATELESLNRDLTAKQQELQSTQNARVSLQKEVSTLEKNIAQLQVSIKADQVTVQKLGLEIDSLNYDIKDIQYSIENKNKSVGLLVSEIYQHDTASPLLTFLQTKDLSQTLSEAQAIKNFKTKLREDAAVLSGLKAEMEAKLQDVNQKKSEIETRQKSQVAKKAIVEDQQVERKTVLAETKNKESLYQQQVAELKKQQDSLADEIEAIEDELRAKFNPDLLPTQGHGVFAWPVALVSDGGIGRITQHFGEISRLYRGKAHNGLDIGISVGTPIYAVADGIVTAVGNNDQSASRRYQYGKYVLIRHSNNLSSLYAHLSKQVVTSGSIVKRGDLIGYSGNTGYATGPHLHLGVYWTASIELKSLPPAAGLVPVGVTISPEDYL